MRIHGYTFEAAEHCPACTLTRHSAQPFALTDPLGWGEGVDEHGLPYAATDREGNAVHPIFDSRDSFICDTCLT